MSCGSEVSNRAEFQKRDVRRKKLFTFGMCLYGKQIEEANEGGKAGNEKINDRR